MARNDDVNDRLRSRPSGIKQQEQMCTAALLALYGRFTNSQRQRWQHLHRPCEFLVNVGFRRRVLCRRVIDPTSVSVTKPSRSCARLRRVSRQAHEKGIIRDEPCQNRIAPLNGISRDVKFEVSVPNPAELILGAAGGLKFG